jgi:hypothetical protein
MTRLYEFYETVQQREQRPLLAYIIKQTSKQSSEWGRDIGNKEKTIDTTQEGKDCRDRHLF